VVARVKSGALTALAGRAGCCLFFGAADETVFDSDFSLELQLTISNPIKVIKVNIFLILSSQPFI
jgi:hypothetical protein